MKGHGAVLSRLDEYKLTQEQLELLHKALFEILCDFKRICDEHELTYMLCGGTLLGAVRHHGFIPWDDDVDVMMPRADYEKLAAAYEGNKKYAIEDPRTSACTHKMIKIMRKGTRYVEIGNDNPHFPGMHNLFIDVFPIDNMPKGKAKFRAWCFDIAFHASNFISEKKYRSPIIQELSARDKEVKNYYKKRYMIASLVRLFGSAKAYMRRAQKLANYKKETGYLGIPLGVAYNREKFKAEILNETTELDFCGEKFKAPLHYHEYLVNLYGGNYMTPPPPNEKGSHAVAELKFAAEEI